VSEVALYVVRSIAGRASVVGSALRLARQERKPGRRAWQLRSTTRLRSYRAPSRQESPGRNDGFAIQM